MSKRSKLEDLEGAYLVGTAKTKNGDWKIGGNAVLAKKADTYGVYTGTKDVHSLAPSDTVYPVLQSFVGDAFMDGDTTRYHLRSGRIYEALSPRTNGEITLGGEMLATLPLHFDRIISAVDPERDYNLSSVKENYLHVLRVKLTKKVGDELEAASSGTGTIKGSALQGVLKDATSEALDYVKDIGSRPVLRKEDTDFLKGFSGRWHADARGILMRAPYLGTIVKSDTAVFPESGIIGAGAPEDKTSPSQANLFEGAGTNQAHKILDTTDWDGVLKYVKEHPAEPESFSIVHSYRGEPEAKVLFTAMGGFANHKLLAALSTEDVVAEVGAHESEVQRKPEVLASLSKESLSMVLAKYPAIKSAMVSIARESGAARTALEGIGEL